MAEDVSLEEALSAEAEAQAAPLEAAAEPAKEAPQRRALDASVEEVLREEAERERRVREEERNGGLESQPDLGIEEAVVSTVAVKAARERAARMRGAEPSPPEEPQSRRDLLPDIDSINSTLRSQSERKGEEAPATPDLAVKRKSRKRGFRLGFGLALLLAAGAFAVYRFAPEIAVRVPEAAPYLDTYVNWVNDMRTLLDRSVVKGTHWLLGLVEKVTAAKN